MTYPAGEALILAQLQAISGGVWTADNSSIGKWKMLNSGKSDHYAFLYPGPGQNQFVAASSARRDYSTVIQVWQRYKDDGTSVTNLENLFEGIIHQFDVHRKLADTTGLIDDACCDKWDEPVEQWGKGSDGPAWLMQKFYIGWKEESNAIAFAE